MASKGKKKKKVNLIKLISASGYTYHTYKNPKNTEGKLVINKYDPNIKKHAEFTEKK